MRILIVDANEDRCSILEELLERVGHHVRRANSGTYAISRIGMESPDVVVVSSQLEDVELDKFCRAIKNDPSGDVVIAVYDLDRGERLRGRELDCDLEVSTDGKLVELVGKLLEGLRDVTAGRGESGALVLGLADPLPAPARPDTLVGSLGVLGFSELVQMLAATQKTGCLTVHFGQQRAQIYLARGTVRHAELESESGAEAVASILEVAEQHEDAQFRFRPFDEMSIEAVRPTIGLTAQEILMEASVTLDHRKSEGA